MLLHAYQDLLDGYRDNAMYKESFLHSKAIEYPLQYTYTTVKR